MTEPTRAIGAEKLKAIRKKCADAQFGYTTITCSDYYRDVSLLLDALDGKQPAPQPAAERPPAVVGCDHADCEVSPHMLFKQNATAYRCRKCGCVYIRSAAGQWTELQRGTPPSRVEK